ncbi:MAG TPA: GGDEF domain-containing protein [Edaphobacter sp.]|jgi:diguanylate cyclase (GGDEF)-like protein|nr:GGDEF domain-containing protein [Edaphobacter sp.]
MDTTTLVVANVLLFALCAGVILVNARTVGGMPSAVWFAGANLFRGASILLIGMSWLHLEPARFTYAMSGLLAMGGVLMLHQSFAELLEQRPILRGVQYGLAAGMAAVLLYSMAISTRSFIVPASLSLILGLQYKLVAALVFRFSDDETGPVGWLTSLALITLAITFILRGVAIADPGWHGRFAQLVRDGPLWLLGCLLTTAATAFGFMSLSTAKLRVELQWRAQVDDLTGLLNRWAMKSMALREIQRSRRGRSSLAVVIMDLDGLKTVNDTKGHSCGDVVLQTVAGVLQETVRACDSVARLGGDEFCILLPDSSLQEAIGVAERLRSEVEELIIRYRGETVKTRASLGVASSDFSGLDWQRLIDDSDAALYRAKREGKNRVYASAPVEEINKEGSNSN